MTAFDQYAVWYDAFNEGKDYAAEARHVLQRVRPWQPHPARWLDIGCGTGRHAAFLRAQGIQVEGVDASATMIARARAAHPDIPFHVATAQGFRLDGGRDVISMLFHVLSYQVTDAAVSQTLANVAEHLAPQGVFVFDFWHTGGVLRDPPGERVREAKVGGRRLFRIARPHSQAAAARIDVHYEFRWDSPQGPLACVEEHAMRHFSARELEGFLAAAGLEAVATEGWAKPALAPEDWYGLICARKRAST